MAEPACGIYDFGSLRLDTRARRLFRAGTALPLAPKSFELLRVLVESAGRALSKAELLESVWPDVRVEEGNLSFQVAVLRKALGPAEARWIETVPRFGYRCLTEGMRFAADPEDQSAGPTVSRLPAPRTALVGRDQELAAMRSLLLSDDVRLITLTGAGGCGKTRLALQIARETGEYFQGGTHFAPLVSLTDSRMVASALAQIIGMRHTGGSSVAEALYEYLARMVHAPTLLVIDNFEHLLPAAPILSGILEACVAVKLLVTSRAVLHLYGEHEFPLAGLVTPDTHRRPTLQELSENPAVNLFIDRATAVNPAFELTSDNGGFVAGICARLDGLPLAIELAAARVRMLTPAAILARLGKGLELLADGARDLPARHQTIRSTIEWSYDLLTAAEQKLFLRLSVFAGGCTLESAEAVCDPRSDLGLTLLDGISSLVEKSMLQRVEQRGDLRFAMLETVREYGLERLADIGETEATLRAHAAYCLVIAEEGQSVAEPAQTVEWLSRCEDEHGNLRAAIDWLIRQGHTAWAMRLCLALFPFWERREHFDEGRAFLQAALGMDDAPAGTRERAMATACAGALAASLGDWEDCHRMHQESLSVYRKLGDAKGIATQLNLLGANQAIRGSYPEARSLLQQSLRAWRDLGDPAIIAGVLSNLADAVNLEGDHLRARILLGEALSIFRELGDDVGAAWSLNYLGDVARDEGDGETARQMYEEGANTFRRLGHLSGLARSLADIGYLACERSDYSAAAPLFKEALAVFLSMDLKRGVARVLDGFAFLASGQHNCARALKLAGSAAALRQSVGARIRPPEQARVDAAVERARKHLDAEDARSAWQAGWQMSLDEAVRYALLHEDSRRL